MRMLSLECDVYILKPIKNTSIWSKRSWTRPPDDSFFFLSFERYVSRNVFMSDRSRPLCHSGEIFSLLLNFFRGFMFFDGFQQVDRFLFQNYGFPLICMSCLVEFEVEFESECESEFEWVRELMSEWYSRTQRHNWHSERKHEKVNSRASRSNTTYVHEQAPRTPWGSKSNYWNLGALR